MTSGDETAGNGGELIAGELSTILFCLFVTVVVVLEASRFNVFDLGVVKPLVGLLFLLPKNYL